MLDCLRNYGTNLKGQGRGLTDGEIRKKGIQVKEKKYVGIKSTNSCKQNSSLCNYLTFPDYREKNVLLWTLALHKRSKLPPPSSSGSKDLTTYFIEETGVMQEMPRLHLAPSVLTYYFPLSLIEINKLHLLIKPPSPSIFSPHFSASPVFLTQKKYYHLFHCKENTVHHLLCLLPPILCSPSQ